MDTITEQVTQLKTDFDDVYDAGKQAQYDEFWDTYQWKGGGCNYESAFVNWQNKMFFPKYDIIVMSGQAANHMFYRFNADPWSTRYSFDLSNRLKECNVKLDTSKSTSFNYMFASSGVSQIPELSTINASVLNSTFYGNSHLHTIEKLILKSDGTQSFQSAFHNCSSLANIVIDGVIGKSLDIRYSPLTRDSLMSIINHLKDRSADTSGSTYKLTIGSNNIAKLTADELKIIDDKGWQYA